MGKFDGVLICTDLDGTLLKNDKSISKENRAAIEYFKAEGGYFTFITGRMPYYASDFYHAIKPNAPVGCINGGGLYDFAKQEYIWKQVLPREAAELVRAVDEALPTVGFQVSAFYRSYFCKDNNTMVRFRQTTRQPDLRGNYAAIPEPMAKVLFGTDVEEEIRQVERILRGHPLAENFDFIRSEKALFEILPKGIGKGNAITKLAEHLDLDMNKTIAIGDYNNDISMFHAAKVGVAVANACPDALAAADHITVSNEEHAVAQIICDLEQGKLLGK